jgi:hypothetical protein
MYLSPGWSDKLVLMIFNQFKSRRFFWDHWLKRSVWSVAEWLTWG